MSAVVAEETRNKKSFGETNQLYITYTCKTIYAVIKNCVKQIVVKFVCSTGGSFLENVCYPHMCSEKYYDLYNILYKTTCASEAVKSRERKLCVLFP